MILVSARHRLQQWDLDGLLMKYAGLRIAPSPTGALSLSGPLAFRAIGPMGEVIEDEYTVEITVSSRFPSVPPTVLETDGRIPTDYHKLAGNALCLGAPTALRMRLTITPSLVTFVDEFVVPYLAGYTHFAATGLMLFGELAHGDQGIRDFLAELFHSKSTAESEGFVWLASLVKRRANKYRCPCGSGRRLGKCHNRIVNAHRCHMGRKWFAAECERLERYVTSFAQPRRWR
jgi:hypothetical protein